MNSVWFVRGKGKVYGPLDSKTLRRLVADGKINEFTEVAQNEAGPWLAAGKVRGLFAAPPAPAPPLAPPRDHRRTALPLVVGGGVLIAIAGAVGGAIVLRSHYLQEQEREAAALRDEQRKQKELTASLVQEIVAFNASLAQRSRELDVARRTVGEAIDACAQGALLLNFRLGRQADEVEALQHRMTAAMTIIDNVTEVSQLELIARDIGDHKARFEITREEAGELVRLAQSVASKAAIDPQELFPARLERAQKNIAQAGGSAPILLRAIRDLEATRHQVLNQVAIHPDCVFTIHRAEQQMAAINDQSAALEAATLQFRLLTAGLGRAERAIQSDLDEARREADLAKRRDLGFSTPRTRLERERREEDLQDQQAIARRAQADIDGARTREEENALKAQMDLLRQKRPVGVGNAAEVK